MGIYFFFVRLFALFGHQKAKKMCLGQKNNIRHLNEWVNTLPSPKRIVWFHVASVGEFEQARPIIEKIKHNNLNLSILLTFFSPSGYELRKNYQYADYISYLPFATKKNARSFINTVQPHMAVFVKYEYWPAYLNALQQNKIPTFLISAIFDKKQFFFHPFGRPYRKLLTRFTHLYVQDQDSANILHQYDISNVTVTGDTRFDRVTQIAQQPKKIDIVEQFLKEKTFFDRINNNYTRDDIIVAGSIYEEDDLMLSQYIETHPNTKLIIVPHEITDKHLHALFQIFKGRVVQYSHATTNNVLHTHVLIIDTVGILSQIYQYADVAYIGGGFNKGIHNILEAAVYGIPVVFGPNYAQFREARRLIQENAAVPIYNYASFQQALEDALLNKKTMGENALAYIKSEQGASDKIYNELFSNVK